jgi:hypothetical protein
MMEPATSCPHAAVTVTDTEDPQGKCRDCGAHVFLERIERGHGRVPYFALPEDRMGDLPGFIEVRRRVWAVA